MKISNLPKRIELISAPKENSLITASANSNTVPQTIPSPKKVNFIPPLNKSHTKQSIPEN